MIAVQEQVEASLMAQSVSPASPPSLLLQIIHFPKITVRSKFREYIKMLFLRGGKVCSIVS